MAESRHWRRASLSSRETVRARERNRLSARSCTSTLPTRSTSFRRSRSLALVFTGLQVRQANRARRDQAAVTVIQTALSENSARILELFGEIPEDTSASLIDNLDAQTQRAILEFGLRLEVMGYMAFRRLVDLETVNELAGGAVLGFWSRVKPWAEDRRKRTGHAEFLEWCDWLAARIGERRATQSYVPAYSQHANSRE